MPIQLSPGVAVVEKDFTNIVPTIASSACGFAGVYVWGPVMQPTTVSSENNLVAAFGKPTKATAQSFLTAANFLSYSSNLLNIRIKTSGQKNATAGPAGTDGIAIIVPPLVIDNAAEFTEEFESNTSLTQAFAAKYPGKLGNSIGVSIADGASFTAWEHKAEFQSAPGISDFAKSKHSPAQDELHVIVIDSLGEWTGTPGAVLEKFAFVSKASNAKTSDGTNNYFKDVINQSSSFVWSLDAPNAVLSNWGVDLDSLVTFSSLSSAYTASLIGGVDDYTATDAEILLAYRLFTSKDLYPLAYIAAGKASTTVAAGIIGNVAEVRKDVIVFVSPEELITGAVIKGNGAITSSEVLTSEAASKIKDYREALPSSSFASIDTGYKYQYDVYNDQFVYVPLNGDIAGLCARTDASSDPWFSPGGLNRGQIKNVVKLAVNPSQADRDMLYPIGVNPVVSFPGQGVVLYGDKTMLAKPSAFDRIGVRRLFIVLEKSIEAAAKFQLFEFNDGFTRTQFVNMIEPFLRDIKSRRGINDYQVVCDNSNNTDQVISSNNFVADIYIKPNYSINFITLNFIAGRQSVSFSTLGA